MCILKWERRRRDRVSGAQIRSAIPIMIIGMKSSIRSLQASGNENVPAGAKSRVAMTPSPMMSLLIALMKSFILESFQKVFDLLSEFRRIEDVYHYSAP